MDCASAPVRDVADLGPVTIPWTARYRLRSQAVGQDYQIDVAWPPAAPRDAERLPVVLVLDGNHALPAVVQAARALQAGPFPMPPTVVVGVGYHFETPQDQARWGRLRVRDFTPCSDALFEAQYPAGFAPGGANAFLDFLDDELTPFLAERLPVDPADRTLVGASLGGLLALYAMLTRPQAFRRLVTVSPAIYWGDGKLFELEAALAARARDLPVSLFLAAGGLEEGQDAHQGFVSNLYRFESALRCRGWRGLDLALRVFEGENHMSVFPGAVTRGLGHVFGGYPDMSDWSRALAR